MISICFLLWKRRISYASIATRINQALILESQNGDRFRLDRATKIPRHDRSAGLSFGRCQTLSDGKPVAERFQRLRQIALRLKHVADSVIGHRQIALPARVAGVGLRQTLRNYGQVGWGERKRNPSYLPQHNLFAKIGLLWYEINDFSNAKKPTALRTVPSPKLIHPDNLALP